VSSPRPGLHWVGVPCVQRHCTWRAPGITSDPAKVGCKRCARYLLDPTNWNFDQPSGDVLRIRFPDLAAEFPGGAVQSPHLPVTDELIEKLTEPEQQVMCDADSLLSLLETLERDDGAPSVTHRTLRPLYDLALALLLERVAG